MKLLDLIAVDTSTGFSRVSLSLHVRLRSLLRSVGITRAVSRLRWHRHRRKFKELEYEFCRTRPAYVLVGTGDAAVKVRPLNAHHFATLQIEAEPRVRQAIVDCVHAGDIVWDVGGNIGYYALIMAKLVRERGKVVVFEPTPDCVEELLSNIRLNELGNVFVEQIALGDVDGVLEMEVANTPMSRTNRLRFNALADDRQQNVMKVRVMPGDLFCDRSGGEVPNIIKVDVEGAEEEVLLGLRRILSEPRCHTVICEVHFGILEARGKQDAPVRILSFLKSLGFSQQSWLDAGHFLVRKPQK
jgi:FkbM family methyltransferase